MTVLLLGDSHLAYAYRDYRSLLERHLGEVSSRAVGGAVADDLADQVRGDDLSSYDALVVSVGTNEVFHAVTVADFRATLDKVLTSQPGARWVVLPSPGADSSVPGGANLAIRAAPYVAAATAVANGYGATVVPTGSLLAPLGSSAFVGDGMHLSRAAYDVLVPAIGDACGT